MTQVEKHAYFEKCVDTTKLYTVVELQKVLFSLGHSIQIEDLYIALKATGWIKLRIIRDRLLDLKRDMPKKYPFDGVRRLIKAPLLVDRHEDIDYYS